MLYFRIFWYFSLVSILCLPYLLELREALLKDFFQRYDFCDQVSFSTNRAETKTSQYRLLEILH